MNIKTMEGTRKINTVLLSLLCLQHKTQAQVLPQSKSTLWVGYGSFWNVVEKGDLGEHCREGLCIGNVHQHTLVLHSLFWTPSKVQDMEFAGHVGKLKQPSSQR